MNFYPDDPPSWDYLWENRPRIRSPRLPTRQTWPADITWSLPGIVGLALWTRYTGLGISLNTAMGGLFFPTNTISVVGSSGRAHWHTTGAPRSFTTGVAETLVANAAPLAAATVLVAVPTALYFANKTIIESAPVEQQSSLWQMFSQALTGTGPGIGSAGSGFVG